jgi:Fe2+ or Zn2+ uptake regulation protein
MSFETRTHVGMPNRFLENFALDEFKFRWIDALGLEMAEWRSSTDLYVALLLSTFMSTAGECWPSVESLAKPMRKSADTVRRSLKRLEEYGWLIIVSQPNRTNRYQAKLPEHGVSLLLADRETSRRAASAEGSLDAVNRILDQVCSAHGFNGGELKKTNGWARVEGRMHQLVNRLGGPNSDFGALIRWMCEAGPTVIVSPTGFLLDRASSFKSAYDHAAGKKRHGQHAGQETVNNALQMLVAANTAKLSS